VAGQSESNNNNQNSAGFFYHTGKILGCRTVEKPLKIGKNVLIFDDSCNHTKMGEILVFHCSIRPTLSMAKRSNIHPRELGSNRQTKVKCLPHVRLCLYHANRKHVVNREKAVIFPEKLTFCTMF
jgi:hypothetical protein